MMSNNPISEVSQTMAMVEFRGAKGYQEVVALLYGIADKEIASLRHREKSARSPGDNGRTVACKKGCNYCCFLTVRCTVLEAAYIVEYLRNGQEQARKVP